MHNPLVELSTTCAELIGRVQDLHLPLDGNASSSTGLLAETLTASTALTALTLQVCHPLLRAWSCRSNTSSSRLGVLGLSESLPERPKCLKHQLCVCAAGGGRRVRLHRAAAAHP